MKRRILFSLILMVTFAAGFATAHLLARVRNNNKEELFLSSIASREELHRTPIAWVRQQIYGRNKFYHKDIFPEIESQLAAFDPAKSTCSITLSYVGGM